MYYFKEADMEDRRLFTRMRIEIHLKFLDLTQNLEGEGDTVDISANGVGFVTKESLTTNASIDMWLFIPDHHEPLYTKGEVVWTKPLEYGQEQRVGVRLIKEDCLGLARTLWLKQEPEKDKNNLDKDKSLGYTL
jgi:hypothetical protein